MASPQLEDGYTKVSNELLEALCCLQLSGHEWSYVLAVIRKTYGFNKKEDWVTNTQIAKMVGLPRQRVSEAKLRLLAKNVVTENRDKISLNKDYEKWSVSRKTVTGVTENRDKLSRKTVPTKETKKLIKERGDKSPSLSEINNKKNMAWNTPADDADEGVIDYDGDGTVKSTTPVSKKKYPNALPVFKLFLQVLGTYPANWNMNKTQLQAAENLFTERGLEKVKNALEYYKEHKDDKYCPQISQPSDLDAKYTKLGEHKLKQT